MQKNVTGIFICPKDKYMQAGQSTSSGAIPDSSDLTLPTQLTYSALHIGQLI